MKRVLFAVSVAMGQDITLVTFDGMAGTTFKFTELNDPVMGGQSVGTWTVDTAEKFGVFDGEVKDVPSLKAPGFIKAAADGKFANASSAIGGDLVLTVRSNTSSFQGYRVSFCAGNTAGSYACAGGGQIPLSRGCFKAKFEVQAGSAFSDVRIPFNSFSDLWSPATGEQVKTCAEDKTACPKASDLATISHFEIWAEGALGLVHLEIDTVGASPAAGKGARPPADFDHCSAAVQKNLRYGVSGRITSAGVPVAVNEDESLATAVCCDTRTLAFAEPQFLYQAPDITLFAKMGPDTTVFYDSVCGVPLFQTPVNRTLADFQADTNEHGWPSFRAAEVNSEHVITNQTTGLVSSSCGTHLGTYLPDEQGPRWCIDLSCVAGNAA